MDVQEMRRMYNSRNLPEVLKSHKKNLTKDWQTVLLHNSSTSSAKLLI